VVNLQTFVRKGFKVRLFQAHAALEAKEGARLSREEIGKRVGKALGTPAINKSTVASWFTEILPPADVGAGVAQVYGVSGGWLYFGEDTVRKAPPEDANPERKSKAPPVKLTPVGTAAARRKREA
jgi:hypothetical protein